MSGTLLAYGDKVIGVVAKRDEYVQVVANGVKTASTLLNELHALVDFTKITPHSLFIIESSSVYPFQIVRIGSNFLEFTSDEIASASQHYIRAVKVASSASTFFTETNGTIADRSSIVQPNGDKYKIIY